MTSQKIWPPLSRNHQCSRPNPSPGTRLPALRMPRRPWDESYSQSGASQPSVPWSWRRSWMTMKSEGNSEITKFKFSSRGQFHECSWTKWSFRQTLLPPKRCKKVCQIAKWQFFCSSLGLRNWPLRVQFHKSSYAGIIVLAWKHFDCLALKSFFLPTNMEQFVARLGLFKPKFLSWTTAIIFSVCCTYFGIKALWNRPHSLFPFQHLGEVPNYLNVEYLC